MAYIHNPDRGAADLVILAAQDFTAEPIARVHLPARIPLPRQLDRRPVDPLNATVAAP